MDHFAGLDVSVKETSICIVDDAGKIVREVAPIPTRPCRQYWTPISRTAGSLSERPASVVHPPARPRSCAGRGTISRFARSYSITSSARASSAGSTARPSIREI